MLLANGNSAQVKLGPGLAGDEDMIAHDLVWGLGAPSLRDLLNAYVRYATDNSSVVETRLSQIEEMITNKEYMPLRQPR